MTKEISQAGFENAAADLGVDVPAVKAVADVESAGSGFLPSGKVKILFEGHVFSKKTGGIYNASHPTISYKKWTRRFYIGGEGEYSRFTEAFTLNPIGAMLSASWGKFQIMGYNYGYCGFGSVGEFVDALKSGEDAQLKAFIDYCRHVGLDDDLRAHNWDGFAEGYNGPLYQKNRYAQKLQNCW